MSRLIFAALTACATVLVAAPAMADTPEFVNKAASATAHGVGVAKDAVVHAAGVAADGVETGARKASEAITGAAEWAGLPVKSSSPKASPWKGEQP